LGTSTFLEGAPASRKDLQRRDSEDAEMNGGGGLMRKKSIAQRIRGMSAGRRERPNFSPEARYQIKGQPSPPTGPHFKAASAGGPVQARYNKENEVNPFDNDYEDAFERKGAQIKFSERPGSPREAPPVLSRTRTTDGRIPSSEEDQPMTSAGGKVGGFLNRMRSVKGGPRRPRNNS
jgi:hypothetical protein